MFKQWRLESLKPKLPPPWIPALDPCCCSLIWFTALDPCSCSLLWILAFVPCSGSLLWFTALELCYPCSFPLLCILALVHCSGSLLWMLDLVLVPPLDHCSGSLHWITALDPWSEFLLCVSHCVTSPRGHSSVFRTIYCWPARNETACPNTTRNVG